MMSPYEGERIFEAEMARLYQCDRALYSYTPLREEEEQDEYTFSLRAWFAALFFGKEARQQRP
ncbi:MAG: hypothetical protein H3C34_23305, partial [Caldilineaceae bacterium]|nr:hypothetical protein [Caldilineaceae bacterium]